MWRVIDSWKAIALGAGLQQMTKKGRDRSLVNRPGQSAGSGWVSTPLAGHSGGGLN